MTPLTLTGGCPLVPGEYFVEHRDTRERLAKATVSVHPKDRLGVSLRRVRGGTLHTTPTYVTEPERLHVAWADVCGYFFKEFEAAPPVTARRVPAKSDAALTMASGTRVHPFALRAESLHDYDLSTGFANECRWASQMNLFYCVAQHSTLVGLTAEAEAAEIPGADDRFCAAVGLQGHLHDAPEGLGFRDLATPMKHWYVDYMADEAAMLTVVLRKYFGDRFDAYMRVVPHRFETPDESRGVDGFVSELHPLVWRADRRVLITEKRDLKPEQEYEGMDSALALPDPIIALPREAARSQWLDRLHSLVLRVHA